MSNDLGEFIDKLNSQTLRAELKVVEQRRAVLIVLLKAAEASEKVANKAPRKRTSAKSAVASEGQKE